jgi:hypothetical protein
MDVMEQIGDGDGKDTGDGSKIAAGRTAAIGDEVTGAAIDEVMTFEFLGAIGSGN